MDCEGVGAISRQRLKNGVGGLGPDERLRVVIVGLDEGSDVSLQLLHAAMHAAFDLLVGEQREPAFDLVEPGRAGRCEVQLVARMAGEPGRGPRVSVSTRVTRVATSVVG